MADMLKRMPAQTSRLLKVLLAAVLALTLIPLMPTDEAYAASGPPSTLYGGGTVTGIAGHDDMGPNAFWMDVWVDGHTVKDYGGNWPNYNDHIAYCIDPGAPYPDNGMTHWGRFDHAFNDEANGTAWYKATFFFSEVSNYLGLPYQNLGEIYVGIAWSFTGSVKLVKSSSAPSITNGSSDHSLEGATYELRRASDGHVAATLVTDANDEAYKDGIEPGDYKLVEIKAPKGFEVDTTAYGITVTSGNTATAKVKDDPLVWLELQKSSGNPDITNGNACYSFENAVYGVYKSSADASKDANRVTKLTTNKDGYAKSPVMLSRATYYVKELTPPKGYAKDYTTYEVTLSKLLTRLNVKDMPQGDPAMVAVGKIDADTTSSLPQGDTSLKGGEFTVAYYDGYYTTEAQAKASGNPTRTWIIKTDENGEGRLRDNYLAAGSDPLYKNSYGDATIPLGTVVIKETKAPANYLLPNPVPVSVQQVTSEGELENVSTYNTPKVPDVVKRGDISITKFYDDSPDEDTGTMVPEAGITFDVYASHQFDGTTPKEGVSPAFTLVTDEFGRADTLDMYIIEQADGTYKTRKRTADDHGALPHDTYLMVQRDAVEGYEKIKSMPIFVGEDNKVYDYLLQNGTIQTPLKVVKVDSETGEVVPYPASWQIISMETGEPVSMTTHYPTTQTFDVFTSDEEGRLTLPEKLPWGDYELKEVLAPVDSGTGYLLNPVNVVFSTADGYDWDRPLEIVFADAPAKGRIEVMKTDSMTGEVVPKATYVVQAVGDIYTLDGTLRASDGEVVATITTDEYGYAVTDELYLGRYDVIEAISPDGFALDTKRHGVTLEYEDQTVPVVTHTLEVIDVPTTLRIAKIDSATGEPMADVSFLVAADEGEFEEVLVTDDEGTVEISYLPRGAYHVTEVETPFGYVSNTQVYPFFIDDQGLIEGSTLYTLEIENTPIQVEISKRDITTDEELPGAKLAIYKANDEGEKDGDALYEWISTDKPHLIERMECGDYILHEDTAPLGYELAQDIAFTVEETGDIQQVVMHDELSPEPEVPSTPSTPETPGKGYDKTGFDSTLLIVLLVLLGAGSLLGLGIGIKRHHRKAADMEEEGDFEIPRGEDLSEDDDLFKD